VQQRTLTDGGITRDVSTLCLGTMYFGTTVHEQTAFAILDRYVDAGGNFVDTANCYTFWVDGGAGGESEQVLGRWLRSRGNRDDLVIATKIGAGPREPDRPYDASNREGLSAEVIEDEAHASLKRMGLDHVDLLYAHADDRQTRLEETTDAFGRLVEAGDAGLVAASNHTTWRLALARRIAEERGMPRYAAIQQRHSYLEARHLREHPPDAVQLPITPELLDYARSTVDLAVLGYSVLLSGAYTRPDRPLPEDYDTAGAPARLAMLDKVAAELDATPNQVVLAWMMGGDPPIIPLLGVSSVEQLDECLGAADLHIDQELRDRLDEA
jgi:aryl-alcohol dehydrogenase-like predicted oxidoreductase